MINLDRPAKEYDSFIINYLCHKECKDKFISLMFEIEIYVCIYYCKGSI